MSKLSIQESLKATMPKVVVTQWLLFFNLLVFMAMLYSGAGFWHSPNQVQLAWGANFAPATEDGQWWRLGTAMFLHFGAVHLTMNMLALWDGGQLVERMYGHARYLGIYVVSGLMGNLLSLVVQGNAAVSGGASGAIFGIFGALLVYLWWEREHLHPVEFRWLFGGATAFSILTILMGFIIKGIDNSAHIGGFATGLLMGLVLKTPYLSFPETLPAKHRWLALLLIVFAATVLVFRIPAPKYKWRDEVTIQKHIEVLMQNDQAAMLSWQDIVKDGKKGDATFDELAGRIETDVTERYENSFEALSKLPTDPDLPSAKKLQEAIEYAQKRRDAARAIAEKLRSQPNR